MKRLFKRCLFALLALATCAAAARAVSPRALIEPFFAEGRYTSFGGDDLGALLKAGAGPVSTAAAKFFASAAQNGSLPPSAAERLGEAGAFACRVGERTEKNGVPAVVFAAEIPGGFPSAPEDPAFDAGNVPPSAVLVPAGVAAQGGTSVFFAFLALGEQNFLAAASDPSFFAAMAAPAGDAPDREPPASDAPLWISCSVPPSKLTRLFREDILPAALKTPLRVEASLVQTEASILVRARTNLDEFCPGSAGPSRGEKPLLLGRDSLCALLSFEGPGALPARFWDALASAAAGLGIGEDELASILGHRVTLGLAGTSSGLFGAFPGFYAHLAGAKGPTAEKLLSLVERDAERKSARTEKFASGGWEGLRTPRWSLVSAYAAASDEGFVFAFGDSAELGRTARAAPEIERLVSENRRFIFALDARTLTDSVDSIVGALGGLFLDEERRRGAERALGLMDALERVTVSADSLSECEAEISVNPEAFGRLTDEAVRRFAPSPDGIPAVPPPAGTAERDGAFAIAAARFKKLFPEAEIDERAASASALYDGKRVTMTASATADGRAGVRFAWAASGAELGIGPERAERLARQWRDENASSPCELKISRNGSAAEIELSLSVPAPRDGDGFVKRADRFLAALDAFCDLL